MVRRPPIHWLMGCLLACTIAAGSPFAAPLIAQASPGPPSRAPAGRPAPPASDTLRFARNLPGDAKPIVVAADELFTWQEGGYIVVLMRGRVLVQQSFIQTRFDQGVAWVDVEQYKRTGIWQFGLFAEGQVHLDTSSEVKDGPRAVIDLSTRGELKLHALRGKVARQVMADDPVVVRGRAERPLPTPTAQAPAKPQPIQRTGLEEPLPPPSFLPGALLPPTGGPPTTAPVAPPPERPVPVRPPRPEPAPGVPPSPGARGPAPPGPTTWTAFYQPEPAAPSPAVPGVGPPPLPPPSQPAVRPPDGGAPAGGRPRPFSIVPRSGTLFNVKVEPPVNGEQAVIVTGGVIIQVRDVPGIGLLDLEADQLVFWSKGNNAQQLLSGGLQSPEGKNSEVEFYLKGNVEIRRQNKRDTQTIRADEVYYDVRRNVAIALSATLEMRENPRPGKGFSLPDPVIFKTDELQQLSATQYKVNRTEIFSSKLPSDPGLKVYVTEATIDEKTIPRQSIFGRPVFNRGTGAAEEEKQTIVRGRNVFFELENVPFFYLPYLAGNANDPLGPIEDINFGYSRIYGVTTGVTLNVYDLLGLQPYQDTKWKFSIEYLGNRGPAVGTDFDYASKELFGLTAKVEGFVKGYAIYDDNFDVLGGNRPINDFHPPNFRGRLQWRQNVQDLPDGFSVQSQIDPISDRNFLEMYYKREFDSDINQETFVYVKQQQDSWAWTVTVEPRLRRWVTEAEALPALDARLLGMSLFDVLTSNTRFNLGYYQLQTSTDREPTVSVTDRTTHTGRIDLFEELSAPLYLGPVRTVPYVKGSVTGYTEDLNNEGLGRLWGGGGIRASLPLTHIYPDAQSELFNVNGINHKIVLAGNYFYAAATSPYTNLPQIDRLNDDPTDQALRDIRPQLPTLNPQNGVALATDPMFDPQLYAIRRLIDNRIDTRDYIEAIQFDVFQRLQTKRGYPGAQHIVDWMTLDLSGTYFPESTRDELGHHFGFLQYEYIWNIGDRTAFTSTGWVDPVSDGARVFTVGGYFNRTDRTSFYLGYRQIEPVQSRAITGSVSYVFSPKYALTAASTYDFGTSQSLSNSLVITRIGSDIQVSLGISYNALTQNFGAVVEVVPNLVPANRRIGGVSPNTLLR